MNAADFVDSATRTPELAWLAPFLSPRLPEGWKRDSRAETDNGAAWRFARTFGAGVGLFVMVSGTVERDARRWVHVSFSRRDRMPSYEDSALVKRLFIGRECKAIHVFPPESEHYNLHPYCLHLWHCVDGDGLPDFRSGAEGGV